MTDDRPSKEWIQTYTGRRAWPGELRAGDVEIRDIARALSNLCRFTGHVRTFYSVAEHSIRVSMLVPPYDALAALLHDASEAYVADLARPVKRLPELAGYRQIEGEVQRTIFRRFGLEPEMPASVHLADNQCLRAEALALKSPLDPEWMAYVDSIPDAGITIDPVSPKVAERLFLARFSHLTTERAREAFWRHLAEDCRVLFS